MEEIIEVRRILERSDKIKYLIIPKKSQLVKGDLVIIRKLNTEEQNGRTTEQDNNEPIQISPDTNGVGDSNSISRWKSIRQLRSISGNIESTGSN